MMLIDDGCSQELSVSVTLSSGSSSRSLGHSATRPPSQFGTL